MILLRMVAAALGLRDLPADKSGVLLRLQSFFEATHRSGPPRASDRRRGAKPFRERAGRAANAVQHPGRQCCAVSELPRRPAAIPPDHRQS